MARVHPEAGKMLSGGGFGLGNLALMMRKDVVFPAGVDIDGRAKESGRHRGTLDMPAGRTRGAGGWPFHEVAFIRFPKKKARRMFLGGGFGGASARAVRELFNGIAREFSIS